MNWLDILLLLLIVGVAVLGMVRGLGRAAFDALGLYGALWAASTLAPLLAAHLTLNAGGAAVNLSWVFGILFVLLGALMLGVSWYVHSLTRFDAGMFDKLLGLAAGVAMGVIVAHSLVAALVTSDPHRVASAALVADAPVGREMYEFPAYHSVMDTITGATTYRRELPNVGGK